MLYSCLSATTPHARDKARMIAPLGPPTPAAPASPLVGREREQAALRDALAAAQAGHGQDDPGRVAPGRGAAGRRARPRRAVLRPERDPALRAVGRGPGSCPP